MGNGIISKHSSSEEYCSATSALSSGSAPQSGSLLGRRAAPENAAATRCDDECPPLSIQRTNHGGIVRRHVRTIGAVAYGAADGSLEPDSPVAAAAADDLGPAASEQLQSCRPPAAATTLREPRLVAEPQVAAAIQPRHDSLGGSTEQGRGRGRHSIGAGRARGAGSRHRPGRGRGRAESATPDLFQDEDLPNLEAFPIDSAGGILEPGVGVGTASNSGRRSRSAPPRVLPPVGQDEGLADEEHGPADEEQGPAGRRSGRGGIRANSASH